MDKEDEHSPSVFCYPEDLETFDAESETSITECHIINNLLTELAGEYQPSVVPRPRANIPQYGPRARIVSG